MITTRSTCIVFACGENKLQVSLIFPPIATVFLFFFICHQNIPIFPFLSFFIIIIFMISCLAFSPGRFEPYFLTFQLSLLPIMMQMNTFLWLHPSRELCRCLSAAPNWNKPFVLTLDLHTTFYQGLLWGWDVRPHECDVSKEPSVKFCSYLGAGTQWELEGEEEEDGDFTHAELCKPLSTFCPGSSRLEDEPFTPHGQVSPRDKVPLGSPSSPVLLPTSTPDARQNREYAAYLVSSVRSLTAIQAMLLL